MTPLDPNHSNQALAAPSSNGSAGDAHVLAVHAPSYGPLTIAGDGPTGPPGLSSAPTLSGLLQAVRRRWLLAVCSALLGAACAVLAVFLYLPPRYVVEARINVSAAPEASLFGNSQDSHAEFAVFKEYVKAQIHSHLVLAAALNEKVSGGREARDLPAVRAQGNNVLDWMDRSLKADFKVAPEIMSAWLAGDDPEGLADLLNAICTAFVKESDEKEKSRRRERLEAYRENLKVKEQELSNLRNKLNSTHRPKEVKDRISKERQRMQAQQDMAACKVLMQNLQTGKDATELELSDFRARAEAAPKATVPADQFDDYVRADGKSQVLLKQIEDIDYKIASYQGKFAEYLVDKYTREGEDQRAIVQEKLEKRSKELLPSIESRYRLRLKTDLAEKIDAAQRRCGFLAAQIKGMRDQAEALGVLIASLDATVVGEPADLLHLKDEVESTKKAVDDIRATIVKLSIEGSGSRVSLQMRASPPNDRDYSRQTKLAGAGGVSAFGFVLFAIALWEFRARRISDADEISRGLGLNVVGTLPAMPARARVKAGREARPRELALQAQLQEAVDGVRTMLLHAARTEPLRVIMVTSANGGEGKTSVASQLAASLARSWRKTLLIDGDLRNPAAHTLFDLPREPGLSEVLRGEVAVDDAVRPAAVSRLWVLPAGHCDSSAIQALAQDDVHRLFAQLKTQYDFIIVDSCPVLPVADALLLGQHMDAVIFSILRDVSRMGEVYAAQQRLAPLGIRTLGAVAVGMASNLGTRAYQYAGS